MSVGNPPIDALAARERLATAASSAELAEARLCRVTEGGSQRLEDAVSGRGVEALVSGRR